MVGNRLAIFDMEAAPAFALGSFEPLEQVEEWDRRCRCLRGNR